MISVGPQLAYGAMTEAWTRGRRDLARPLAEALLRYAQQGNRLGDERLANVVAVLRATGPIDHGGTR